MSRTLSGRKRKTHRCAWETPARCEHGWHWASYWVANWSVSWVVKRLAGWVMGFHSLRLFPQLSLRWGDGAHTTASSPPLSSLSSVRYCPGFSVLLLRSCPVERRHLPYMKLLSWTEKQPPAEHPGSELLFTQQVPNIFWQKEAVSLWSVL